MHEEVLKQQRQLQQNNQTSVSQKSQVSSHCCDPVWALSHGGHSGPDNGQKGFKCSKLPGVQQWGETCIYLVKIF